MGTFASVSLYDRGSSKPVSGRAVRVSSWPAGAPVETDPAVLTTDYYGATPEFSTIDPDVHAVRITAPSAQPKAVVSIEKQLAGGGGGGGGAVDSVNGKTGTVVLSASDVGAQPAGSYATGAQGAKADTAVQPDDLAAVATSGAYADLSGKPTIPSSPGEVGAAPAVHTHGVGGIDSGGATAGLVLTADGSGGAAWAAPSGGGGGGASVIPFCHLRPDGTQTLEGVSEVLWQQEVEDASGMHGTSNLGRITAPTAGVYLITGVISFRGNGSGSARAVQVRKNGTTINDLTINTRAGESSTDPTGMPFTVALRLAAGDYVQIYVWVPSGATGTPSPTTSVLTVAKIGA